MANLTQTEPRTMSAPTEQGSRGAMPVVTALFFMWGFITCLNDILIPHLQNVFELNYVKSMLVQFAFFSAYFIFALPSGKVIEWIGYKKTMVVGLLAMALGALMFIPAASALSYPMFLAALIILAGGITALQTSANPYVAVLGAPETASSRLNLTQAFNSLGTTIAPYLGSLFILSVAPKSSAELRNMLPADLQAYRLHEASSVKLPYLGLAIALLLLAAIIAKFHLPKLSVEHHNPGEVSTDSVWNHPHLIFGAIAIFLYVGGEVSIGSFLVKYFHQPEIGNLAESAAAKLVSFYWMGAMIGRFIGSAMLRKLPAGKLLGVFAAIAAVLVLISMTSVGHLAVVTILAVGLFNSIMFPSIFTLAIEGLGTLTSKGSALLVMAIVGGAIVPVIQGALADRIGIHHAFILPVLCYAYIMFFGFKGSKRKVTEEDVAAPVIA